MCGSGLPQNKSLVARPFRERCTAERAVWLADAATAKSAAASLIIPSASSFVSPSPQPIAAGKLCSATAASARQGIVVGLAVAITLVGLLAVILVRSRTAIALRPVRRIDAVYALMVFACGSLLVVIVDAHRAIGIDTLVALAVAVAAALDLNTNGWALASPTNRTNPRSKGFPLLGCRTRRWFRRCAGTQDLAARMPPQARCDSPFPRESSSRRSRRWQRATSTTEPTRVARTSRCGRLKRTFHRYGP